MADLTATEVAFYVAGIVVAFGARDPAASSVGGRPFVVESERPIAIDSDGERQRDRRGAAEQAAQAQTRAGVQRHDAEGGDAVAELIAGDENSPATRPCGRG